MRTKPGFVLREVGEGTVVVPTGAQVIDMNGLIVLNDTGKFIWQRLDGSTAPGDIAAALTEEYEVTLEQAQADVDAFLAELRQMGVLEDVLPAD